MPVYANENQILGENPSVISKKFIALICWFVKIRCLRIFKTCPTIYKIK